MKHLLSLLIFTGSLSGFADTRISMTCSNSATDYLQIQGQEKIVMKENDKVTRFGILGSDTYEHTRDCGFFCRDEQDGWVTYYVLRENPDVILNVIDLYDRKPFAEVVDSRTKKILKRYESCK